MTKLYLSLALRNESGRRQDSIDITLPVTRVWFEGTSSDLHIQFEGYDDLNICPSENSYEDELMLPVEARLTREWLKDVALPKKPTFCCCLLEVLDCRTVRSTTPPAEVIADLVNSWGSPNSSRPYPKF